MLLVALLPAVIASALFVATLNLRGARGGNSLSRRA